MRVLWFGVGLATLAAAACGGGGGGTGDGTFVSDAGSDARASSSSGTLPRDGGSSGTVDPDASSSGATSSSGGSDGGDDDGGSSGTTSSSSGSSGLPPQCAGDAAPGADLGVVLELGEPAPSSVTVSEDGLTVAWVTGTAGDIDVHFADRTDVDADFGTPQTLHGAWAVDRVALGSAGLVLAALRADRLGFDAYEREAAGDAFVVAAKDPFGNVNEQGAAMADAGQSYGDPVLAHTDSFFIHSRYGGDLVRTLLLGSRLPVSTAYSQGTPFTDVTFLDAVGADRRRPVALTDDQRTLFYYDEVDDLAYATSRDDQGGSFGAPVSLGARLDARPIAGCGTLVFRDPATPSQLRAVAYE